MPDNKLKQFHDYIKGNPNISGVPDDFNVFQSALKNPSKSKAFFDAISNNQAISGLPKDYNTFITSLGIVEKKNPNTPTASSGTANSTVSKPNPAFKTLDYGEIINKVKKVEGNRAKEIKPTVGGNKNILQKSIDILSETLTSGAAQVLSGAAGLVGGLADLTIDKTPEDKQYAIGTNEWLKSKIQQQGEVKNPEWYTNQGVRDYFMGLSTKLNQIASGELGVAKIELGIEPEKSTVDHLINGDITKAGKSLGVETMAMIPQLIGGGIAKGSKLFIGAMGAVAAGGSIEKQYGQDKDISITDVSQAAASGLLEYYFERFFNSNNLATGKIIDKVEDLFTPAGVAIKDKIIKEGVDKVKDDLIRGTWDILKEGGKGAAEESLMQEVPLTVLNYVIDSVDENKYNKEEGVQLLKDMGQALVTPAVTGGIPSIVAAKISKIPYSSDEKIKISKYKELLGDSNLSKESKDLISNRLFEIKNIKSNESSKVYDDALKLDIPDRVKVLNELTKISKLENDVKSINDVDLKDEMLAEIERRKQGVSDILNSYSNEAKQEPTPEQIQKDIKNKDFYTFEYSKESDIPSELKDKVSSVSEVNGKKTYRVTLPKSQANFILNNLNNSKNSNEAKQAKTKTEAEQAVLGKTPEGQLSSSGTPIEQSIETLPIEIGVGQESQQTTVAGEQSVSTDVEAKKADIERRRQEELKSRVVYDRFPTVEDGEFKIVGDPNNRTYRINENTGRPQELDESNGLWSNTALAPNLFMESTKRSGFEKSKSKINAKYDAELKELENNNKTLPTNETEQTTGGEEITGSGVLQAQEAVSLDKSSVEIVTDENADKVKDKVKKLLIREGEGGPLNRFLSKASEFLASKSTVTQWVFDKLTAGNKMAVQAKEKAESFKGDIYDKANNILNGLIKTTGGDKGLISNAKKIISLGNLNDTIGKLVAPDVYTSMSNIIGNKYTPDEIKSALSKGDGIIDATKRNDILNSIKDINEDDIKKFKEDYANKISDLVGEYININKPLKFKKEEVKLSQQPTGREASLPTTGKEQENVKNINIPVSETRNITDVENDILSLPNGSKILSEVKLAIKNRDEARKILMSTEKGKKVLEYSENARALVDDLSREIELSPATKNILEKIGERVSGGEGFYLKRTFKYWKDKKFTVEQKQKDLAQKNIENTIYALKAPKFFNSDTYLKANPEEQATLVQEFEKNISEDARIDMELYLDEIRRQRKDKGVFIPRSTTAKIDGRNLMSREILDETFLDLIGNTNDAISQFSDTVMAQAQILSAANLQYEINELAGEGLIYGSDREIIRERGDTKGYSQVNDPNGLLHKKWVRNDIYQVLSDGDFSISNNIASKAYYKTLGFMRKKNTIYNVATGWFTNLSGGFFNQVAQGLSVSPIITGKMLVGRLSYIFGGPSAKQQSFIQDAMDRMKAQGLWNTSVSAKFINALDQDYMSIMNYNELSGIPQKAIKKLSNELSKADKKMTAGYTSIDDFTKMLMFVQKQDIFARKLYGKKFDKLSKEEKFMVDTELAERIKQNIPTSSRLPGIYKSLLKVPLGDFIGFRISALQTSMNTYINAADDVTKGIELIKNGDSERGKAYLQDGMATIGAMGLISYLGNIGWQQVMSRIHGEEEDEEKVNLWTDYKGTPYLMPNWLRGRNAVVYKDDGLGNLVITNVSNKDPYDEFNGLVIGVKGMTRVERVKGVLGDVLNPNMLVQFLDNIRKGKDAWGDELVSGDATDSEKAMSYSRYITEQLLLPPAMLSTIRDSEKQARKKALEEKLKTDPEFEGEYERATISKKKLMEKRLELPYIDIAKESPDFLKNMIHRNYNVNIYNQFSFSIEELMENRKTKFEDLTPEQSKERIGDLSKVRDAYEYLVRYNATNEKAKNPEEFLNDLNKSSRKVNLSETEMDYIKTGVYSPENK